MEKLSEETSNWVKAYVALGSNMADPVWQVTRAFERLDALERTSVIAKSSLHRTKPVGFTAQPDFINAVATIQTQLMPFELLKALQKIEQDHGRVRGPNRNGPRTLDLDLLLYDDLTLDTDELTLPHPRMWEREFVRVPLREVMTHESLV